MTTRVIFTARTRATIEELLLWQADRVFWVAIDRIADGKVVEMWQWLKRARYPSMRSHSSATQEITAIQKERHVESR